ncbi:pheromone A receptor-domain-containing protein [Armillaria borealis]|uniref:Pheromone A receptor-domain-containing protein n=1 Tax=Armillaria borealis TaxID=47425 RepID=A0AA39MFP0_9AGAR|nr:pheromone A receptor-domain-containing protein [Armillaria borealis]
MSDPTYPLFTVFAFFGFILPLIPLPWHLLAYNSGTCYFIMWSSIASLNQFVNSVVWKGNVTNWAPIWCDISIRIMIGASVGIPASSLCINRRLYHIANVRAVSITRAEKRRAILIDTLICVLFPVLFIALQYVVQGHRFNIYEDVGCYPALYNTALAYVLNSMWPVILGLISATYCILTLRAFNRRRVEFSQFLSANKSLTLGRYFRLMALATTEICCTTPLGIAMIIISATATPVGPWRSWADTHYNFSAVRQIPALFWRASPMVVSGIEATRWVTVLCSWVFFAFFGFASEARRHYTKAFWAVMGLFGVQKPQPQSKNKMMPMSINVNIKSQSGKPLPSTPTSPPPYSPGSTLDTMVPEYDDLDIKKMPPSPSGKSICGTTTAGDTSIGNLSTVGSTASLVGEASSTIGETSSVHSYTKERHPQFYAI